MQVKETDNETAKVVKAHFIVPINSKNTDFRIFSFIKKSVTTTDKIGTRLQIQQPTKL